MEFFSKLGFEFNPRFTDEKAACMIISEEAYAMLLTEPFFKTFTRRELCDTARYTEGLFALSCSGRTEVDEMVRKAVAAGGKHAAESAGSRLHVRLELLRPRRAPLGGALDGPQGDRVASSRGGTVLRPIPVAAIAARSANPRRHRSLQARHQCNCSICSRTGALLSFVPASAFTLEKGDDSLTDYQFKRKNIHHLFCKVCGVRSFARGQDRMDRWWRSIPAAWTRSTPPR